MLFRSEEIGKVCYVTAMAALGEVGVQSRIISAYAPEGIKRRVLPRVCSGDAILAICMTEPDAGTDTTRIRTMAVREGDYYRVRGQKIWTSRAFHSDLMLLLARTTPLEEVQKRTHGLSIFLIDLWEAANVTMQTYGGFGFAREYDVERKFRETRLYQIAPISTNLILSYIGQHVLGMPRSF